MTPNVDVYSLHTLHLCESTLDEEDSFHFLQQYNTTKVFNYSYKYPDFSSEEIGIMTSNFALFYARINEVGTNNYFKTNRPINVFRYIMLEDGSWSHYYAVRRKLGYVVEGMYWSNGMIYQVRQDASNKFYVYEATLSIDSITKTLHGFPDLK